MSKPTAFDVDAFLEHCRLLRLGQEEQARREKEEARPVPPNQPRGRPPSLQEKLRAARTGGGPEQTPPPRPPERPAPAGPARHDASRVARVVREVRALRAPDRPVLPARDRAREAYRSALRRVRLAREATSFLARLAASAAWRFLEDAHDAGWRFLGDAHDVVQYFAWEFRRDYEDARDRSASAVSRFLASARDAVRFFAREFRRGYEDARARLPERGRARPRPPVAAAATITPHHIRARIFGLGASMATALWLSLALVGGCSSQKPPAEEAPEGAEGDVRPKAAKKQQVMINSYRESAQGAADRVNGAVGKVRGARNLSDAEQVDALRREVVAALGSAHALGESLRAVKRELKHAPAAYRAAAANFRARSEDYSDERFRSVCLEWADHYEALAAACPAQLERTERFLAQVAPTAEFIRETRNLLDDFHTFLTTYVGDEPPRAEVERYMETLRGYAEKFGEFERESAAFGGRDAFFQGRPA